MTRQSRDRAEVKSARRLEPATPGATVRICAAVLCALAWGCSQSPSGLESDRDAAGPLVAGVSSAAAPAAPSSDRAERRFREDAAARALYDRMIETMRRAESLSYSSRYERAGSDGSKSACTYRVWLKKPNYFRMETEDASGKAGGVLVGDGASLWIYWPNGRPRWELLDESTQYEQTRFNSYMTRPAPAGSHSILHEAVFLGGGMVFPVLDPSLFHRHVDSIQSYLDGVRGLGTEIVSGEVCDLIEVSFLDGQRTWRLWLSRRDHLPRKLEETVRVSYTATTAEDWTSVDIGGEIPQSLFSWTPPADWTPWRPPDEEDALLEPGTRAPDFDLPSVSGERIRLSSYRGKSVWLCFWRVGCPPCRVEMPELQKLHERYGDKGLAVLAVNTSDDPGLVADYLHKAGVTFPNILDTTEAGEKVFEDYGSGGVPMNYLINGDGIIVDAWYGIRQGEISVQLSLLKTGGVLGGTILQEWRTSAEQFAEGMIGVGNRLLAPSVPSATR